MPETVLLDTHAWLWIAGGVRIIVATAIAGSVTLVTRDARILAYARRGRFKAVSA